MTADPAVRAMPAILEPEFAPLAAALLRDYYTATMSNGQPWFTGARFESLGGPWNDPSNADRFTAGDVVAVSCLSIDLPGAAAIRILETQAGSIGEWLAAMPRCGVPLWEVSDSEIGPGSSAAELWWLLRDGKDGIGRTTASKLMARKRADLIPIYDSVVGTALGLANAEGHWETMRQLMLTSIDGAPLHQRLSAMSDEAGLAPLVTPLRVFDVLVWYAYNPNGAVKSRAQGFADELNGSGALLQAWDARL
ncbi:DUF6308 family protein [Promicromonospora soli]